jgi:CheY-like chemotaxis protein
VFEPFARGSTGSQAQGSGLGLTIAKMLTDLMGGELIVASQAGQGTTFKVRLFLPELREAGSVAATGGGAAGKASASAPRTGYLDERQRVLVVDNEESDRDMLQRWLQPLGFEVMLATSGHDALRLLTTGYRPHAIFMDLAMPGIDGWETLRRMQALGLAVPAAIVSANAFDQALDNDVGITPSDFLVKPVRREDLLDWLGRKLGLTWLREGPAHPALAQASQPGHEAAAWRPAAPALERLLHSVRMGHVRGVAQQLDALQAEPLDTPAAAAAREVFVTRARALLKEFQLDALERWWSEPISAIAHSISGETTHAIG